MGGKKDINRSLYVGKESIGYRPISSRDRDQASAKSPPQKLGRSIQNKSQVYSDEKFKTPNTGTQQQLKNAIDMNRQS